MGGGREKRRLGIGGAHLGKGHLTIRTKQKERDRPGESYGIGFGGACGLSCGLPIFNSRVSNGIAVPCMTTDVSAIKNTMWKIVSACWIPATMGNVAKIIGTAPRSPAQATSVCSRTGIGENASAAWTLTGRATKIRNRETRRPAQAIGTSLAGNTCSPSVKNMVTCISQASPS